MYIPTTTIAQGSVFHGARYYNNAQQTIANNTITAVTFNTEEFDTDGYHSTVSQTERFTVPSGLGGYYDIFGNVSFDPDADGPRLIWFRKNGTDVRGASALTAVNSGTDDTNLNASTTVQLAAGDFIELMCFHTAG